MRKSWFITGRCRKRSESGQRRPSRAERFVGSSAPARSNWELTSARSTSSCRTCHHAKSKASSSELDAQATRWPEPRKEVRFASQHRTCPNPVSWTYLLDKPNLKRPRVQLGL